MQADTQVNRKTRRRGVIWGALACMLALSFAAPFSGVLLAGVAPPYAAAEETMGTAGAAGSAGENPRSGYWREVRGANSGYTAVSGQETNVLINDNGQDWRRLRNGLVTTVMSWLLLAAVVLLALYHLLHGKNKLAQERSGRRVLRWQVYERALHFSLAGVFILLAITGLSLLFGRAVLLPLIGKDAFAAYAGAAKDVHNYLGPVFCVLLAAVIVLWMRHNFFKPEDWQWLKRGGGMFGGSGHPHAGRFNAGEKIWFWILSTVGVAVCVSGLVLDFPNFGQSRDAMQAANIIHAVLSIGWIAVALGHIYIGTIGTEGALEGMTTGYVSEEWARQHHDLWLAEVQKTQAEGGQTGQTEGGEKQGGAASAVPGGAQTSPQT